MLLACLPRGGYRGVMMAVKLFELWMAGAVVVVISIGDDAANYRAAGNLPMGGGVGGEGRQGKVK